jgi:hypothetical protein
MAEDIEYTPIPYGSLICIRKYHNWKDEVIYLSLALICAHASHKATV